MVKGTLTNGFNYEINDDFFNDWEVLELIDEVTDEPQRITMLAKKMFNKDKLEELKKLCTVEGRVKADKMVESIGEIFEACSKLKN